MDRERARSSSDAHLFYVMKTRSRRKERASGRSSATPLARSRARACAVCNLSVVEPRVAPRPALSIRPARCGGGGGIGRRGRWRGALRSSALLASLVCPRASSERRGGDRLVPCVVATLVQSRTSSRALRICVALRLLRPPLRDSII